MSDTATLNQAPPEENATASNVVHLPGVQMAGTTGTPGLITKIFTGALNANQTATNTVYNLPGWTSSLLNVTVLAADVNSDTNSLYYSASLACYRQWNQPPIIRVLQQNYSWGQSGLYTASVVTDGNNNIQVKLTQGGFATNTYYQIVTQYMLNVPS